MRTDLVACLWSVVSIGLVSANPDAKRLYSNLLANYDRYKNNFSHNKRIDKRKKRKSFYFSFSRLIRPVANSSDRLTVHMRLKLSQVIGVVSTNQVD